MKTFFILLVLFGLAACGKNNSSDSKPDRAINPVTESKYLSLVNNYRKSIGLRPLKQSNTIEIIALDHSVDMANGLQFGHSGFKTRCARLRASTGAHMCGEIVAAGQKTPEAVLKSWLNSPSHRMSIENPNWTHTGIGLAMSASGRPYWTQMFLRIESP